MISEIRWINNQITQAKKPLKCHFGLGKSTTALFFPMIAIEPLSLYVKGFKGLFVIRALKFLAKFNPC